MKRDIGQRSIQNSVQTSEIELFTEIVCGFIVTEAANGSIL